MEETGVSVGEASPARPDTPASQPPPAAGTPPAHPTPGSGEAATPMPNLQLPSPGSSSSTGGGSLASSPRADVSPRPAEKTVSGRHNHVSTTVLHGVPIVSLTIDGKERLCLAQISNTLLKPYSYNEIHNRRVALGITCVQCTPVQLEILRRAGAMPISSRRCGMITKREAERLVKSFLDDATPPKLPDNFAFDVKHECGWGSRGSFIPSRYNSSRAKCIKCSYCNMYFSPNKFIFHYHRVPDSKYHHPDAANFNSWRRHLHLTEAIPSDDLLHAWEDVKAMFNGGTRKRILTSVSKSFSSVTSSQSRDSRPEAKRPKFDMEPVPAPPVRMPPPSALQYPVFPMNNKVLPPPIKTMPPNSVFGMPFGPEKPNRGPMTAMKPGDMGVPGLHDTLYPPYEMIWAKHLGLNSTESGLVPSAARTPFPRQAPPPPARYPTQQVSPAKPPTNFTAKALIEGFDSAATGRLPGEALGGGLSGKAEHASAFTPVGSRTREGVVEDPVVPAPQEVNSFRDMSSLACSEATAGSPARSLTSPGDLAEDEEDDEDEDSDCENVDVDTIDDDGGMLLEEGEEEGEAQEQNNNTGKPPSTAGGSLPASPLPAPATDTHCHDNQHHDDEASCHDDQDDDANRKHMTWSEDTQHSHQEDRSEEADDIENKVPRGQSVERSVPKDGVYRDFSALSKEQLQEELLIEIQVRKKIEEDCRTIKETFREQVDREKQYRDEMSRQLQIVRESLCQELDQERKARFTLQQKLKEAHDALHNFSCKMLASRQCAECAYKEPVLPR